MKAPDFWNCDACGKRVYSDPCEHCGWNPCADMDTQINRAMELLAAQRQRAEKAEARVAELLELLRNESFRLGEAERMAMATIQRTDDLCKLLAYTRGNIDAALQEGGKDD